MQDGNESNYKIDFDILISIKPDTDGIMYFSEFYQKKMRMKYFTWFLDSEIMPNFQEYAKLWNLNFEDVPFTIDGKKCKMPSKHFQSQATGEPIPDINDIVCYLDSRNIYFTDITQNDLQNYISDYFMFPLFEKDRIEQKEKLFEEIFEVEARVILRENGIVLDIEGFWDFIQTTRKDIEKLTGEEFKEVVVDYYFLKSNNQNNIPQVVAEESEPKEKPQPLTFEGLFPSVADKDMVMSLLQSLKIINSEGKYLLGNRTGIIRVFIDVMKEEGCFVNIERKKILRVFTPEILGRTVETIKEPDNFNALKGQILRKYAELKK